MDSILRANFCRDEIPNECGITEEKDAEEKGHNEEKH